METRRRHAEKSNQNWGLLPQHLLERIFAHLEDSDLGESFADLRLVSKSWLAAVKAYPGHLRDVEIGADSHLKDLCKMMPNMVGLEMSPRCKKLKLQLLASLSRLTHLSLDGSYSFWDTDEELRADLSGLPRSLEVLWLRYVYVPPESFTRLKCVNLRSLGFDFGQNKPIEVWQLLQHLPKLESLQVGSTAADCYLEDFFTDKRLQGLTGLAISCVNLVYEPQEYICPPNLQELSLSRLYISYGWLNAFTSSALGLRLLEIESSTAFGFRFDRQIAPCSSLDSLVLKVVDFDDFLDLAHGNLKSLSLLDPMHHNKKPRLPHLSQLTGLTRLELEELLPQHYLEPLRGLALQELVLINCEETELKLFDHKREMPMPTLRKLHIEDTKIHGDLAEVFGTIAMTRKWKRLERIGRRMFQMPELIQVSGWCNLFLIGMRQGLEAWQEAKAPVGTMVTENHHVATPLMTVWTKPVS